MHPKEVIEAARQEFPHSTIGLDDSEVSEMLDETFTGSMFLIRYHSAAIFGVLFDPVIRFVKRKR